MSSGFISEAEIAANKQKRQEEWEKVRQPNEPLEVQEEPYDSRSLYEKLKEQKDKKDYEYEEAHKLKNLIRGLDDDEVDFLHVIDKAKANADHKQHMEEDKELREFREQVASMQEKTMNNKIQAEIAKPKVTKMSTRPSQKSILSGMVRKRAAAPASTAGASSSSSTSSASDPTPAAVDATEPQTPVSSAASSTDASATPATSTEMSIKSPTTPASVGLRCIGVLPGLGRYHESSDSEKSTDTDDDYDYTEYDWLGRSIKRNKCERGGQ